MLSFHPVYLPTCLSPQPQRYAFSAAAGQAVPPVRAAGAAPQGATWPTQHTRAAASARPALSAARPFTVPVRAATCVSTASIASCASRVTDAGRRGRGGAGLLHATTAAVVLCKQLRPPTAGWLHGCISRGVEGGLPASTRLKVVPGGGGRGGCCTNGTLVMVVVVAA
jgi:hypothetical protein